MRQSSILLLLFLCMGCSSSRFSKPKNAAIDLLRKSNDKKYDEALLYFREADIATFNNPKSKAYEGGVTKNIDRSTHNGTISDINIYGGFVKNDTANILLKLKFQGGQIIDWNGNPYYFQMIREKRKWKVLVTFPK